MRSRTGGLLIKSALVLLGIVVAIHVFILGAVLRLYSPGVTPVILALFWSVPVGTFISFTLLLIAITREPPLSRARSEAEVRTKTFAFLGRLALFSLGIVVLVYLILLGGVLLFQSIGEIYFILVFVWIAPIGSFTSFASLLIAVNRANPLLSV